ncbi:hypothetical protein Ahy_A05g023356 isoform B [Arachis hypogaea]|uniref:Uncharacterized protein n=1 Tax=Arachis hypogaea TaxID=3818 RepID=A0A445D3P7_ARAHY|nr:hypothetical protein Ahy_A05g023356 isoform B [Arachis hypogaea]
MHDITENCFSLVPSPVLAVLFLYPLTSKEKILPRITHWQSPNYFAYFPSNSSIVGFLGEMLSAGFNIVGFSWITSPAAIELEIIVLDWLAKALKLPHDFHSTGQGGGVIQGTASEAIGGLNPERYRSLKTDASTNYALSPEVFSEAVSIDIATGLIPFFLCATVGTTSSSTAIDPLPEMRRIAKQV